MGIVLGNISHSNIFQNITNCLKDFIKIVRPLLATASINGLNQGPTLTFEGTCPFGQSNPKIYLPEKKFNLPPKILFCTLFIINTVTSYFVCLFSIFMRINYRGIQFRMTISL